MDWGRRGFLGMDSMDSHQIERKGKETKPSDRL